MKLRHLVILILFLFALALTVFSAPMKVNVDSKTRAIAADDGTLVFDWKGTTLTLGSVTISDAAGIRTFDYGSTNGTKLGATGNKIGFLGATPIVRPSSTTDLRQALINLGLYTTGGSSPLNLNGGAFTSGTLSSTTGTFSSTLAVTGNATLGGTLGVTGAISGTSLTLSGNETITGTLSVTGASTLHAISGTNETLSGTLDVSGISTLATLNGADGDFSGTLNVDGDTTMGGLLGVTGDVTLDNRLAIGASATVGTALGIGTNLTVGGTETVTGASTLNSLTVTNGSTLHAVTGTTGSFSGTFNATGNSTFGGTLGITGALSGAGFSFSGNGAVTGNQTVGGTFGVTGATTLAAATSTSLSGTINTAAGLTNLDYWDVRWSGVDITGSPADLTANTTSFNAARTIARNAHIPLLISGNVKYNSVLALTTGETWIGAKGTATLTWGGANGGTMVTITAADNCRMEGITFDGNSLAANGIIINGSKFGIYIHNTVQDTTTGACLKITGAADSSNYNTFINNTFSSVSDGTACLWVSGDNGLGGGGNAAHNLFENTTIVHGGTKKGLLLGGCDNNTFVTTFIFQNSGSAAGVYADPTENVNMPAGNIFVHLEAIGGWVQPAETVAVPAIITGYQQDNGEPDPVLNGTTLFWNDNAGNFFLGKMNGLLITKGAGVGSAGGASLDLGDSVVADKLDLYHSGNTRYGMGIGTNEFRIFPPTGGHVSFGRMSTSDGTTFTEGARIYGTGGVNLGGSTDPGVGNLSLTSITVSTALSARAYNNADLSIADATTTVVTLNSERWDNDGIHSTSSNTSRMTCVTAGIYSIVGNASWDVNSTGTRQIYLRVNGSTIIGVGNVLNGVTSQETDSEVSTTYSLGVGDYVELIARQTSGGALLLKSHSAYTPELTITRQP